MNAEWILRKPLQLQRMQNNTALEISVFYTSLKILGSVAPHIVAAEPASLAECNGSKILCIRNAVHTKQSM
mgnify:CR=1 FL=1